MRAVARVLAAIVNLLVRADVGLWYLLDFRRKSLVSWLPCVLMAVPLSMAAGACLVVHNGIGAAVCVTSAIVLIVAKAAGDVASLVDGGEHS